MLKKMLPLVFMVSAINVLSAQQNLKVTGSVRDDKGNAIPYAFIRDRPFKNAVYADSVGSFKITVEPQSYLEISSPGYSITRVSLKGNDNYDITLHSNSDGSAPSAVKQGPDLHTNVLSQRSMADDNQNFSYGQGAVFAAPKKEDVHGSRFLFEDWVHGYFINTQDSLAQNSAYLYNYNKIDGNLLITKDQVSAIQIDPGQFKSFTLFNNSGEGFTFVRVPGIDPTHFVQVLSSGKNYDIYKRIVTHLKKADFSTNGMSSSGNNYDEYINDYSYYIVNTKTNQIQKITLRKKALKEAFAADADKLNSFMAKDSNDIDESYLTDLGDYMNQ